MGSHKLIHASKSGRLKPVRLSLWAMTKDYSRLMNVVQCPHCSKASLQVLDCHEIDFMDALMENYSSELRWEETIHSV